MYSTKISTFTVRVPTAQGKQGKQGKWPKKFPVRENTGNLEFCQNTGNFVKTQGFFFAQVVNALILKVKKLNRSAKSVLCM